MSALEGRIWRIGGEVLRLDSPLVMGIVNVTPDSFSDGGLHEGEAAITHGRDLLDAGADIVDVGGESTRPGAAPVDTSDEMARVLPVVTALANEGARVSIDTMKPRVAEAAIDAGAVIVNDVTGLRDPRMRRVVADGGVGAILMHMQGTPRTMQDDPTYDDVVDDLASFFADRLRLAVADGIPVEALALDPGIGFGKTVEHNLTLIARLAELATLGRPLVVGVSRKRFVGSLLGIDDPRDRDRATAVLTAILAERGADVVRVHDAAGSREALILWRAIVAAQKGHQ